MLTVHHLGISQSERIVWLCEELGLAYELKLYEREPVTRLAPPHYLQLHPAGTAPVMTDGALVLAESGAIMEYILAKYGAGHLAPTPDSPQFGPYLFWFHYANSSLQPVLSRNSALRRLDPAPDHPTVVWARGRMERSLTMINARLGEASYLAGDSLTAADIMSVFSLTTMRVFLPFDLAPYSHILAYLQRIGQREAYQRAMHKSDPGFVPMLT
jgi:glutathione S-transferase